MFSASQFELDVYVSYLPVLAQASRYDACSKAKEEVQKAFFGEDTNQQALPPAKDEDILLSESEAANFFEPFTLGKNERGEDAFFIEETYRCNRLDIESKFRNPSGECFIRVAFWNGGVYCHVDLHNEAVMLSDLRDSASDLLRTLVGQGLDVSSDSTVHSTLRHELREYIIKHTPSNFAFITSQPGIREWRDRKIFIGQIFI